ncbi:MAG: hypothetical protein GX160_01440 [Clostridiales bacterium]|nr:hypothetical protein [Clostridiales bacterium]
MGKGIRHIIILTLVLILFTGCSAIGERDRDYDNNGDNSSLAQEKVLSIDPDPRPEEHTITIYFKHRYSDYLVPEVRTAVRDKQSWEQLVVEEILKGPSQHDRVAIMPPGVRVLDVTRKDDTVFVNLSQEFNENINLSSIPGKEDIPEETRDEAEAEMKLLGIYSIVNSLTELEGVDQVRFLIENRAISYTDLGEELASLFLPELEALEDMQSIKPMMVALSRDRSYILTPSKSVETVFESLLGEPNWDTVYSLLSKETASQTQLSSKEDLASLWSALVSGIELDDNFVLDEEIKPDGRAFVTVSYTVNFTSGKKENMHRDTIVVVNEDNIWKVKLPGFVSDFR